MSVVRRIFEEEEEEEGEGLEGFAAGGLGEGRSLLMPSIQRMVVFFLDFPPDSTV